MSTRVPAVVAVDFETKAIGPRPREYPPRPVGVAIDNPHTKLRTYLAWGHPPHLGNNCSKAEAVRVLRETYARFPVVYHNAAFDLEVGERHLGLKPPADWHDTMLLAFLDDPRQGSLSLKPLSTKELGRPPREQDRLNAWLKSRKLRPGADISEGPVELVGPYAIGDATRTRQLFKVLYQRVVLDAGMGEAYDRERRLVPVLNRLQARGIPVDMPGLRRDVPIWFARAQELEAYLIKKLGGRRKLGEDFKLSSHQRFAEALEAQELLTDELPLTDAGNKKTDRDTLQGLIANPAFFSALAERSILLKYISTYGLKWLENSVDGRVYPRINQVHGYHDASRGGGGGARTGRLSMSDSWQAIPVSGYWERYSMGTAAAMRRGFRKGEDKAKLDKFDYFSRLPNLRAYVKAPPGHTFQVRDYSQQELRILAHFEDGRLLQAYRENPKMDAHDLAKSHMDALLGYPVSRLAVKHTGFAIIYGMGAAKLAKKSDTTIEMAREIKKAYLKALPDLQGLLNEIKRRCKAGEPIRTWGGRLYYVEAPRVEDGELREFDYKMINVLIQGSAADCTKEGMIRADAALDRGAELFIQVHDELGVISDAAPRAQARAMGQLKEAMESVPLDVPLLSDGKRGQRWGQLKKIKD